MSGRVKLRALTGETFWFDPGAFCLEFALTGGEGRRRQLHPRLRRHLPARAAPMVLDGAVREPGQGPRVPEPAQHRGGIMSEHGRVEFLSPEELPSNPAFSEVVAVTGPVKTVDVAVRTRSPPRARSSGRATSQPRRSRSSATSRRRWPLPARSFSTSSSGASWSSKASRSNRRSRSSNASGAAARIPPDHPGVGRRTRASRLPGRDRGDRRRPRWWLHVAILSFFSDGSAPTSKTLKIAEGSTGRTGRRRQEVPTTEDA